MFSIYAANCPPGFTSVDGLTDCKPCRRDTYWVNATHCESCPTGYKTDVYNGVSSKEGCKGTKAYWNMLLF